MKAILLSVACAFLAQISVGNAQEKKDAKPAPVVGVSAPVVRQVTDHLETKAYLHAKESVTIVPRVTGYIVEPSIKEGSLVKAGDVLFKIDPRPYQAHVDAAEAKIRQSEAGLRYAKETNALYIELAKKQPNSVGPRELAQYQAQEDQTVAFLALARAEAGSAKLNLEFTVVRAPIDGRIGRFELTRGNLAKQDETRLTTLVSLDPMYVYLDIDERTFLRMRQLVGGKKPLEIAVGLPGETEYPHRATVDFVDSHVNPEKATIQVRALLANAKNQMVPGMSVLARLQIGEPYQAVLVTETVVQSKKSNAWLLVVNADDKVEKRFVKIGALQDDGLRVIASGLAKEDRVIVQRKGEIEFGTRVQPQVVPMPLREIKKNNR